MITQAEFTNCLKSLFNIDGWHVAGLFDEEQRRFVRDPVRYFLRADDTKQAAIWREVEKRQNIHMLDDRVQP